MFSHIKCRVAMNGWENFVLSTLCVYVCVRAMCLCCFTTGKQLPFIFVSLWLPVDVNVLATLCLCLCLCFSKSIALFNCILLPNKFEFACELFRFSSFHISLLWATLHSHNHHLSRCIYHSIIELKVIL